MGARLSSPSPLDDDDLLREILLCLPPQSSTLPRASLVCTRWRRVLSDPHFLDVICRRDPASPPELACPLCKNDCVGRKFTGSSFSIELQECQRKSVIVPFNICVAFNEAVGKTVLFRALGSTYNIAVSKGRTKTRLHGEGWEEFVAQNNLNTGDLIVFTMSGPYPRISVAMMNYGINEEDAGEDNSDSTSDDDSD